MTKKKILLVGYANKYYRTEYVKHLKSEEYEFDILSFETCLDENRGLYGKVYDCSSSFKNSKLLAIATYLKFLFIVLRIPHYDSIHIHSVKKIEGFYAKQIRKKCDKLIASIYGSDVYRVSEKTRQQLRPLFDNCTYIQVETETIRREFNKFFNNNYDEKLRLVAFGIGALDYIDAKRPMKSVLREEYGVGKDDIVITIGYNATKEQHHLEIFNQMKEEGLDKRGDLFIAVPLSYGITDYKKRVNREFEKSGLRGRCFNDYLSLEDVAGLRIISDIMIQVQDTDTYSSSMLEYIYADNIVITGEWLPYDELSDFILKVKTQEDVGKRIVDVVSHFQESKKRIPFEKAKNYIAENSTWEGTRKKWLNLYD